MNTGLFCILAAAFLSSAAGVPLLRGGGRAASVLLTLLSSGLGLCGIALVTVLGGQAAPVAMSWAVPGGALAVQVDGLSALFLLPVFLIAALASIYGLGYWRPEPGAPGRSLPWFQGLMTTGMVVLLLARNSVLFLLGWEVMAVSAFFLIATEHRLPAARQAAWTYLVATHAGSSCLFAAFALLRGQDGSLDWDPAALALLPQGRSLAVFLLCLCGFGLKAGVMPLHVWLPAAHAKAPSHVSAMLSGVMIKMGVYGLLRIATLLPLPPWCGALVLSLGAITALLAVAACLAQGDLKRLLAYSSIENVGIVCIGLGLALLGHALAEPTWVAFGLGGALLHVLNHSLFKPLLFLCAGSVIHATGTRRIDALGGLARTLPRTALGFLAGAWAICGLPLLNGFVGELLLYLGLFQAATSSHPATSLLAAIAIAVLAMASALAVAAFVRAFAAVFLGTGRSAATRTAHESPASMTAVLGVLAVLCLLVGLLPWVVTPFVDRAVAAASPGTVVPALDQLAPLLVLSLIAISTAMLLVFGWVLLRRRSTRAQAASTWDCGFAAPGSPRLQYTASSFAQFLLQLLAWATARHTTRPPPMELFPARARFLQEEREALLHGTLLPFCQRWAERCSRLRILQQGNVHIYLLYILAVLMLLLGWSVISAWLRA